MPKITDYSISLNVNGATIGLKATITYREGVFYLEIPKSLHSNFDDLDINQLDELHAFKKYPNKWQTAGPGYKRLIKGSTESEVKDNFKAFATQVLSQSVLRHNVIICRFTAEDSHFDNKYHHDFNAQHPTIEMSLALLYCTRVGVEGAKGIQYFVFTMQKDFSGPEMHEYRREFSPRAKDVILDDTPENRQFLETMYLRFNDLILKFNAFMSDEQKLKSLIAQNTQLLLE